MTLGWHRAGVGGGGGHYDYLYVTPGELAPDCTEGSVTGWYTALECSEILKAPGPRPGGSLRCSSLFRWYITIPSTINETMKPTRTRHTIPSVEKPWRGWSGTVSWSAYLSSRMRMTALDHPKPVWIVYSPPPPASPGFSTLYWKHENITVFSCYYELW